MKNQNFVSVLALLFTFHLQAQDLIINSRFGTTYTHEQNGLIMTSTLGPVINGEVIQNNIIVVTDHLLFPFSTDTTFIREPGFLRGVEAYPNPVPDIIILHREEMNSEYSISIFNSDGKLIRDQKWDDGTAKVEISFSSWSSGWFVVTIRDEADNLQTAFKILKK